jgi:formamidopyrimidine-DNA glycosylase
VPELPEVETIARGLDAKLRTKQVSGVCVKWERSVEPRSLPLERLVGAQVNGVTRAGKFVVLELDGTLRMAVHLRMTGRLLVVPRGQHVPYERLALHFSDGSALVFADMRKFGRVRIFSGDPAATLKIGLDPLGAGFSERVLRELLARRKTPIKVWLLDQRRLAGIGNIYASEALYYAGIRPKRRAKSLSVAERRRLLCALRKVLRRAIRHRGSSVDDYVDAEGMKGGFQKLLAVYGRTDEPCRRCRTPIRRSTLSQRGTFYCPACQR